MCDSIREYFAAFQYGKKIVMPLKDKRKIKGEPAELDVRNFFVNPNNLELQNIVKEWKHLSEPEKVACCETWVSTHIAAQPEQKDFWQFHFETLARKAGDCEDISILLANLILASGVKYYKVMLHFTEIQEGKFHVFVTYNGHVVDPLFPSVDKIPANWNVWFSWNRKNAYTKMFTEENKQ